MDARALVTWLAALLTLLCGSFARAAEEPSFVLDCAKLDCSAVLPGATRFEPPPAGGVYQVGLADDGARVGWVVLSTDVVDIPAYSGNPLVTLVGLTGDGTIAGAKIIHHSEPILLVGIPEKALHDFVDLYSGQAATAKIVVGSSSDPDAMAVDVISGATVTALAQNQTILDTARFLGEAVGVVEAQRSVLGHFVHEERRWTWEEMVSGGVFGRLTVTESQVGYPDRDDTFIDLWFTLADAPQIGAALIGERDYAWLRETAGPDEHLLVILGNGSSSFKGSGFVRGGLFDRVRLEQGLRSVMFRDRDYHNLPKVTADGAPRFKEGAVFRIHDGQVDPGMPFEVHFIGSRYDGRGGFSREFAAFAASHTLPESVYAIDERIEEPVIWRQAWHNQRVGVAVLGLILAFTAGLFVARRWLTADAGRLGRLQLWMFAISTLVLGFWLHAQPSVTQVLTLVGAAAGEWRWDLFLMEPLLFVFWIFIAIVSVVWGRGVFCGWLCPYGGLSELVFTIGRRLGLRQVELPRGVHRWLRHLRYGVLAVLAVAYMQSPELGERLAEVEPFKTTFFVAPWTRQWFYIAWWVLLLVAALVWFRPFCRYLCPLGGALSIISSLRFSGPRRRRFCSRCTICTRACEPLAIDDDGVIDPRECLSCMVCEANYRDETVCPPLVGIARLRKRSTAAPGEPPRLQQLREDAERLP